MGEHLRTWSETEYTNAGEVMQNVGKIQEGDAKKRYQKERWREGKEGGREREHILFPLTSTVHNID